MSTLEERLIDALHDGGEAARESPDLFARVELSIADDRRLRRQHAALAGVIACAVGAVAAVLVAVIDRQQGEVLMACWNIDLVTTAWLYVNAWWDGPN